MCKSSLRSGQVVLPLTPVYTKVNYGEMNSISITYSLKYEVSFAPHYKFTSCKKCINCKTGREIRKVYQKQDFLSATEIKIIIEKNSQQRISKNKLGKELKAMGFKQDNKKVNGEQKRGYYVITL